MSRQIQIYVMTHKPFEVPPDPMYLPVHVGRKSYLAEHTGEESKVLTYTGDDSGDNISDQNCYFSELTGMYWVWKNAVCDYVGICHYRRYLLNEKGYMFTAEEIQKILASFDIITTKRLQLNFPYEEGFSAHHKPLYLKAVAEVLRKQDPEGYDTFRRLVRQKHTYFGNMLITDKKTYDSYMEWLFSILFEVKGRVKVEEEDSYHRRIFGFLSEFLQYVWIVHHHLKVYECKVGMLGEKAEVTEAKNRLSRYFAKGDYEGAKLYFLETRKKRPDLLMEASDVTGELHLCMEVIAIAGLEQEAYGTNLLDRIHGFEELMHYCSCLNRYVSQIKTGKVEPELKKWRESCTVTSVAYHAAESVMASASGNIKFPMKGK